MLLIIFIKNDKIKNVNYKAFYRTYRPSNFNQVVGQDHIVRTLVNLIKMNKISHGYLFSGPRGTGKTSIAKIFANAINCIHSETPEEICQRCLENSNKTLDIIEIDAASNNSVNDIRTIREQVEFAPTNSPYKIYIIDEVHMLSKGAFNALLMTLEEPPAHAIFILATTDPDKIPDTILSRVQRYNFKRIPKLVLESQLKFIFNKENIKSDKESIEMIASLANGSLRDALSIADQINAYSNSNILLENIIEIFGLSTVDSQVYLINLLAKKSVSEALQYFDQLVNSGIDISKLIVSLIELLKDFLIYEKTKNQNLVSTNINMLEKIIIKNDYVYSVLDIFIPLLNEIKYTDIPQQLMQLAIIKICSINDSLVDIEKKEISLESLKNKINQNLKSSQSIEINSDDLFNREKNENLYDKEENEYHDITDEYFSTQNIFSQSNNGYENNNKQIFSEEKDKNDESHLFDNNQKNNTKTILADFSSKDIEKKLDSLIDDFSLDEEIAKLKDKKDNEIINELNHSLEQKLNDLKEETQPLGISFNATRESSNLSDTNILSFKNENTQQIIDDTTELLNKSHEIDGNDQEINESLLSHDFDINKQVFDTNEINVGIQNKKNNSTKILDSENNEESYSFKVQQEETQQLESDITKEFILEKKQKTTAPIEIDNKLSQPKIINLFLLSKKETFDIFKQKLESSSCTDKEEYDSYAILLKEVRFVCSSNDFILVSSEEDWVIEDLNKKSLEQKFKVFVAEYFGNNIHFYAITKKDYIVSKELFSELRKSGKMPEAKELQQITNIIDEEQIKKEIDLNEIENKSKKLFGDLFSRKKE